MLSSQSDMLCPPCLRAWQACLRAWQGWWPWRNALWVRHEVVADRPELLPLPWAHGSGAAACRQLARERVQDCPLALAEPVRALPLIDVAQHVLGVLAALLLLLGREIAVGQGDGVALRVRPPCRSRRRQVDEALLSGDASQRQEVGGLHQPNMGEGGSVAKEGNARSEFQLAMVRWRGRTRPCNREDVRSGHSVLPDYASAVSERLQRATRHIVMLDQRMSRRWPMQSTSQPSRKASMPGMRGGEKSIGLAQTSLRRISAG